MVNSEKKFKIVINGISSSELLLWEPMLKDFLLIHKECICSLGRELSDDDKDYLKDILGNSDIDAIETIKVDTQEELILFFCLADLIPTSFSAKGEQKACCFFGGMSSSNLSEQLDSARKRKITTLYSDLLPCEIKNSISPENFEFFKEVHEFLPHAHNETTIETNSHLKSKVLYVRDKISRSVTNALAEKTLMNALSQKEEFEVLDLSNTDLSEWITRVWPGKNYEKIIVGDISIPLQHLLIDICRLKSIELQYFLTQSFPSPQRIYLNDNPLFESVLATVSSTSSLRKKVFDILNFSNSSSAVKQEANHETMLKYPSPKMVDATESFCPRKLFTDKEGKLECFRETEHAACEMTFVSSESSLRLNHPYSALDMDEDINSRVIHTLVFLEASKQSNANKASYEISPALMQHCMFLCLSSSDVKRLPILLNLFIFDPQLFTKFAVDLISKTNDENKRLSIINQILIAMVSIEVNPSARNDIHHIIKTSPGTALLQLFINLDCNQFDEFLRLEGETKSGINIIYPIMYYTLTLPRSDGPGQDEINRVFSDSISNPNENKLIVRASIFKHLAYEKDISLSVFKKYDQRYRHIFEKCSLSLFNFAYISFMNSNRLDKEILVNFQRGKESFSNLLFISSCIILGAHEMIDELLRELKNADVRKFLEEPLMLRIKLHCILIIKSFFEVNPACSKIKDFFDSYSFRDRALFAQRLAQLPKHKSALSKELQITLSSLVSPEISFYR